VNAARDSPPPSQRDIDTTNEDQVEIQNQRVEEGDVRAKKSRKSRKRSLERNGLQSTLSFEQEAGQLRLAKAKEAEHDASASRVPLQSNEVATVAENMPQIQPAVIDMPGPAPSQDQSLHLEEEEPHQRSKKRQRTPSENRPTTPLHNGRFHALGWEEQLLQAGFGDSSPANLDKAEPGPENTSATESLKETISANHTAANPVVGAATVEPKSRTPPKKVIKLRTDGRLISPRANEDATKKGRGKRKSGQMAERLSKMLTIRYSRDAPAQAAFGKQIDEILCGATRYKLREQNPPPASAVSKFEAPSKPTHPFFTGKASRSRPEPPTLSAHEEPDTDTSRNARSKSPKKLAVSSKSSWAGFGASFSRPPKAPGSIPAIWPPNGMVHCCGSVQSLPQIPRSEPDISQRKLKGSETCLGTREDVLSLFQLSLSQVLSSQETVLGRHAQHFNHPSRKLLTSNQLRAAVGHRLSQPNPSVMHPAISKLYEEIMTSMSAFDKFECQIQQWDHKYSPKLVANVLTYDANLLLLREWLFGLTVNVVNIGASSSDAKESLSRRAKARAKKKRKVSEGLDDFIVSSEDELSHADEITDPESETDGPTANLPRLSQRNLRRTKAVLLCGPHGCGKTAAVYAAAQELGFEVFEINSGSRRSGRDILDRVGDMTHNHLVRQLPDDADGHALDRQSPAPDATAEIESGRQSTMQSFFQSKPTTKKTGSKAKAAKKELKVTEPPKKAARRQKQSLILLEEVDTLFEDDKQFWTTVLSLLLSSRRPIVMTCTDENLLPLGEMIDVAYLRLLRAPETLAVDYLLLLAANEGHLITRSAMEHLFHLHNSDLRASIVQLNFLCQMALGDNKGGLEWMLIRSNVAESTNEHGEPLRVISADTFESDMTALKTNMGEDRQNSRSRIETEVYLLDDIHASWELGVEDWIDAGLERNNLKQGGLESLRRFEAAVDGLSVADFLPGSSLLDSGSVGHVQ
jgi:sorting nexin-8